MKIWKIHGKLKYSESRYCFANIFATEARIFIIFYVVVNFYLVNLSFKFHKDPFTNARARVVNARVHVFAFCVRVCTWIFTKIFVVVYYSVMSLSLKFHKDLVFCCGDIGIHTSLHVLMCTRACFCFVCTRMFTDLNQNFWAGLLLCYEPKF